MSEGESGSRRDLAQHILPVSATMVGVCITLIGLVKVVEARSRTSHVDEYAAIVALLFVASSIASYISIRNPHRPRIAGLCEDVADYVFIVGLVAIAVIGVLFGYELI